MSHVISGLQFSLNDETILISVCKYCQGEVEPEPTQYSASASVLDLVEKGILTVGTLVDFTVADGVIVSAQYRSRLTFKLKDGSPLTPSPNAKVGAKRSAIDRYVPLYSGRLYLHAL